jgi:hypothetical protein
MQKTQKEVQRESIFFGRTEKNKIFSLYNSMLFFLSLHAVEKRSSAVLAK